MNCKKTLLTVFFLVFFINLSAQQKQNLKKYYKNVFVAEKLLLDKNFSKAAKHYQIAFENKDFAFESDLINALYCEIQSGLPNKTNTLQYTEQLKRFGISMEVNYKKLPNYTSILFYISGINLSYDTVIKKEIEFLRKRDEKYRHNYNPNDLQQVLNVRESDSLNIIDFKKLMQKISVFDEKIVRFGDYDIFFNHWSQSFPDEYDKIISKMLEAVYSGTLDARHYVKAFDVKQVRKDFKGIFTEYGTNFFYVLCNSDINSQPQGNNMYAFSPYNNKNKEHKKWLKQTDKKRKKIFLDKTINSSINSFKLCTFKFSNRLLSTPYTPSLASVPKFIIEKEFCKIYSENPSVIYIFPENNDINCK